VKSKPEEEVQQETKPEVPKPSPFSGFSFGGGSNLAFGAKAEPVAEVAPTATEPPALFGMKPGTATFGSVASTGEAFKADPNFKGFTGAGSGVFGAGKAEAGEEAGGADTEYEPTGEFVPVVPLPELVEVRTGEEDEAVLFSERGVLYRSVQD
jgi:E3 SUMO-protein ligase RanBP2